MQVNMMKRQMKNMEGSPWYVNQVQMDKYSKIFGFFDQQQKGYLDETEIQKAFEQTNC
jgi:Ca2+-binding EF-hand superfamily protein